MSEHLQRGDGSGLGRSPRSQDSAPGTHVDGLVAGYVLAALAPDEHALVERHTRACLRCGRLVSADRRAVAPLGLLVPPATPGPGAKSALLARIAAAQVEAAAEAEAAIDAATATPLRVRQTITLPAPASWSAPDPSLGSSDPAPAPQPPTKRRWNTPPAALSRLAAVPLVLALALAGGWALGDQPTTDRGPVFNESGVIPTRFVDVEGSSVGTPSRPAKAAIGKLVDEIEATSVGQREDGSGGVGDPETWSLPVPSTGPVVSRANFTGADLDLGSNTFPRRLESDEPPDHGDNVDIGT